MRNADNIVVMAAGRVSEQGTHAQLMMKRGIYYGLVRRQAGGDGSLGTDGEPPKRVGPCSARRLPLRVRQQLIVHLALGRVVWL